MGNFETQERAPSTPNLVVHLKWIGTRSLFCYLPVEDRSTLGLVSQLCSSGGGSGLHRIAASRSSIGFGIADKDPGSLGAASY